MGRVRQTAFLRNSADLVQAQEGKLPIEKVRSLEVEFLVDTGASYVCLPKPMIETLGQVRRGNGDEARSVRCVSREELKALTQIPNDASKRFRLIA
ncbi:MAG: retroviral-like aspartic protease family protein [Chloroherpetonaceae bacterium]|nr:retroviral-like aspartic protease family protein [Chloroherpetonaceae bacterium]MDW8438020.1 aspartyl protease family protein [Chloroherpetonaceae bacterium]